MKQYLDLLQTIIDKGVVKESGRAGMPSTKGVFAYQMRFNLAEGFPLLTTKKMPFKLIAHELIWFLKGDTNIKYLIDNNCNIWNGDAYRHYKNIIQKAGGNNPDSEEAFIAGVKSGKRLGAGAYTYGDLGEVYGAQWRNWDNKGIDQIKKVIDMIKKNPFGRRHIISAWNPAEVDNMALPPCHLLFQFNCRPATILDRFYKIGAFPERDQMFEDIRNKRNEAEVSEKLEKLGVQKFFYLDCALTQRSCDSFLGVPFNIASYALLTEVVAKMCGMVAGEFIWNGNDVHIYDNHFDAVNEQLKRAPHAPCDLKISDRVKSFGDIAELTIDDLSIEGYESHPAIKAELSVGV